MPLQPLLLAVAGALVAAVSASGGEMVAMKQELAPDSRYVPVALDALANHTQGDAFPARHVTVQGIPFTLAAAPGPNNLFLKCATWPDWEADPSDFYAAYDAVPKPPDPRRPFLQVPVDDYACVYLLAAAEDDAALSPVVSFRIGVFDRAKRVTIHDFPTVVPRAGEADDRAADETIATKAGNLFLVRVPLGKAIAQDFADRKVLDVEVTKELRLAIRRPDPCRFTYRPLGLPSGVHLFGLTFERCGFRLVLSSREPGHVFNRPQVPTFEAHMQGLDEVAGSPRLAIEAAATDYYGKTTRVTSRAIPSAAGGARVRLPLPVTRLGHYRLAVSVKRGDEALLTRETNFALLAPDTRQHRATAPWGTWDFGGAHYTPKDAVLLGPLYVKAGLRYGMFSYTEEERRRFGVLKGNDPCVKNAAQVEKLAQQCAADPALPRPERFLIYHEDCISGPHVTRTADVFTGRAPYRFDEQEARRFQELWDGAVGACAAVRKHFPQSTIYLGNGNVHLLEEFLRRKFPRRLFDARGNEAGNFQRLPEAQPPDFVANNAGLWMDRQVLDHYGYGDVPLGQCYEICYPATTPGNLTVRTHAAYLVRHILHSMAWEIPVIRPALIVDVGNSYCFSNWGATGLCHAQPDVSPKPAYPAVATLTQVLDGARFSRVVACAAPSIYAVEFRTRAGTYVTCLWTIRGRRELRVGLADAAGAKLLDLMGNEQPLHVEGSQAGFAVSGEPCYLLTRVPVAELSALQPPAPDKPRGKRFLISSLSSMREWTVERGADRELEVYDFACPRRTGEFGYREVAQWEGQERVLEVRPRLPMPGPEYLPMYSVLRHVAGVTIPGEPTEIGLLVNGNGGWGRLIFELEDASGQRWISLGCEQRGAPTRWMADWMPAEQFQRLKTMNLNDWNTADPWGRSFINFEGWRHVRFPLPGNYPGEGYHWPYSSQWRYSGDGVVKYPLRFTRLIITLPERVLHFREYQPVPRQEIYLKDLVVTYEPPEAAFRAE